MRYLFNCKNCGDFEINMSHTELPLEKCPTCGEENPERIFSTFHTGHVNGFCGNSNTWNNSNKTGG